jgi:transketolase
MEGVSEAHIVGMAAGLALEGKIPYVNTIATFLTRRCFEQIVLDLCLHNVPARLISNGSGLVYAPLGPTHLAIEDIAILRPIPNISIIAPTDAVAKGGEPKITALERVYEFGKAVPIAQGKAATILTTGITLHIALKAREELLRTGVDTGIVHFPFIKPMDEECIRALASSTGALLTVEEGVLTGGFGSAVAEILAEMAPPSRVPFRRIGLPDMFPKRYGSQVTQLEDFDITPQRVIETIKSLIAG